MKTKTKAMKTKIKTAVIGARFIKFQTMFAVEDGELREYLVRYSPKPGGRIIVYELPAHRALAPVPESGIRNPRVKYEPSRLYNSVDEATKGAIKECRKVIREHKKGVVLRETVINLKKDEITRLTAAQERYANRKKKT